MPTILLQEYPYICLVTMQMPIREVCRITRYLWINLLTEIWEYYVDHPAVYPMSISGTIVNISVLQMYRISWLVDRTVTSYGGVNGQIHGMPVGVWMLIHFTASLRRQVLPECLP